MAESTKDIARVKLIREDSPTVLEAAINAFIEDLEEEISKGNILDYSIQSINMTPQDYSDYTGGTINGILCTILYTQTVYEEK